MKTRDRNEVHAAIEQAAEREVASILVASLHHVEKQINSIRHTIANKYRIRQLPQMEEAEEVGNHLLNVAFCDDALESMPVDFLGAVHGADFNEELLGDGEVIEQEVKKNIVALLTNLAGTD